MQEREQAVEVAGLAPDDFCRRIEECGDLLLIFGGLEAYRCTWIHRRYKIKVSGTVNYTTVLGQLETLKSLRGQLENVKIEFES